MIWVALSGLGAVYVLVFMVLGAVARTRPRVAKQPVEYVHPLDD